MAHLRADLLNCFTAVASVELDKFWQMAKFLLDYYSSSLNQALKSTEETVESSLAASRPQLLFVQITRGTGRGSSGGGGGLDPDDTTGAVAAEGAGGGGGGKRSSKKSRSRGSHTALALSGSSTSVYPAVDDHSQPKGRKSGLMAFFASLLPQVAVTTLTLPTSPFPPVGNQEPQRLSGKSAAATGAMNESATTTATANTAASKKKGGGGGGGGAEVDGKHPFLDKVPPNPDTPWPVKQLFGKHQAAVTSLEGIVENVLLVFHTPPKTPEQAAEEAAAAAASAAAAAAAAALRGTASATSKASKVSRAKKNKGKHNVNEEEEEEEKEEEEANDSGGEFYDSLEEDEDPDLSQRYNITNRDSRDDDDANMNDNSNNDDDEVIAVGNENNNAAKGKGKAKGAAAKKQKAPPETAEEAAARMAAEKAATEMGTILTTERQIQKKRIDLVASVTFQRLTELDTMLKGWFGKTE